MKKGGKNVEGKKEGKIKNEKLKKKKEEMKR